MKLKSLSSSSSSSLKENISTTEVFRRKRALLVKKTLWCFSAVFQCEQQ
jgi:hypothetical protein